MLGCRLPRYPTVHGVTVLAWLIAIAVVVGVVVIVAAARDTRKPARSAHGHATSRQAAGASRTRPTRTTRRFPITWFGPGQSLKVSGFSLQGPCVYASSGDASSYDWATDPSEILLQAEVRRPRTPITEMGYWPWYSRLQPEARFRYLEWLATGRTSLPDAEGFLFLYYYGLERRLLVDESDREWGLQEVVRLRKLDAPRRGTKEGASFRRYSTGLLWLEIARTPGRFNESAFSMASELTERWTPDLITAPLSWLAHHNRPLPADFARTMASLSPLSQRSVVTKRIGDEFAELFAKRYANKYGEDGMQLKVSKRLRRHSYRPASGGIGEATCQIVDPTGVPSQFKPLAEIWNSCVADLKRLSRVAASAGSGDLTVKAWEAMPDELRNGVDHPLTDQVVAIVAASGGSDEPAEDPADTSTAGASLIPAGSFAAMLGVERRPRLTPTQSRKIAETVRHTGYGIVPDARITSLSYGWDDLVAVLPGLDDQVESSRYNAASCMLRLGLAIAFADGEADEEELQALTDHIDAVFDLSPTEDQRLQALRQLLLRTGSDIRPIARRLEATLTPDARRSVGRLLVVIAATTNGVDASERKALRKAYRALGLPPELLEETIAEILPDSDESMVTVRAGEPSTDQGEAISRPTAAPTFRLNRQAISVIMTETRAVSSLLAEAMSEVGVDDECSVVDTGTAMSPTTADIDGRPPSPPSSPVREVPDAAKAEGRPSSLGRYADFYEALIESERWTRDEAERLAREYDVMLAAAIETINDWTYDELGGPLIEDDGTTLYIDRSMI